MNNRPKLRHQPKSDAVDRDLEETVTETLPAKGVTLESRSLVVQLQESEFQAMLNWSHKYPRSIHRAMEAMVKMATMTEDSAAKMSYAVPRGGKMIEGASIRFAEIVAQAWGHSESDAYIVLVNKEEKYVVARGIFFDFETGHRNKATVQRSIRDKYGKVFNDDMINITCNAACAIAKRNAILQGGVPEAAWMNAWEASRRKAAGGLEGLPKKRQEVLQHFMRAGVAPDRVIATLGVRSEAALTGEHITQLRGMWSALQNGDATLEELFPPIKSPVPVEPENGNPQKKRKTLADLGDDEDVGGAHKAKHEARKSLHDVGGHEDEHLGSIHRDVAKEEAAVSAHEAREALIEKARDDGRTGFHKGLTSIPERYKDDPELAAAWQEEYEALQREEADKLAEEEEDRERYSRPE